ncbi:hypothetical protein EYF80_022375 [Liparis tanakae]|uniref:Uncharacterized protein n=1 Tax=Liparis tanakae TaxID=230148 RepID=A0A4Z2HNK8_9TELE|nr:hypothetical protein EYF80_022375 [Liparis tanakae]
MDSTLDETLQEVCVRVYLVGLRVVLVEMRLNLAGVVRVDGLQVIWTHHAFLDEELGSLQGPGHVLAKSLALRFVQDLRVEGAQRHSDWSTYSRGVKLIFTVGHISIMAALLKGRPTNTSAFNVNSFSQRQFSDPAARGTLVTSKGLNCHFSASSKVMTWMKNVQDGPLPLAMALNRSPMA